MVGHRDVPGKPELLGTTREFLDYFSLKKLDDLPTLAQLKELEDLRVQLTLPGAEPRRSPRDGATAGRATRPRTRTTEPTDAADDDDGRARDDAERARVAAAARTGRAAVRKTTPN